MRTYILAIYSLLVLSYSGMAQRGTPSPSQEREAERERREAKNAERELRRIVVKYEKNDLGEYKFICENKTYCNYIVEIRFPELENLQSEIPLPVRITVPPGTRPLFMLRRVAKGLPVRLRYHYTSFRGCVDPKVDTTFTYLLPVAPGKETRIYEMNDSTEEYGGESAPKGWYALSMHVHSGDTVFAARSGRVTETRNRANLQDSGYIYSKEENFVEISHADCSFGRYQVFRDSAIFVQPGDWVEAGQPLGIAGGDKYTEGPQLRFSVRYNQEQDVPTDSIGITRIHHWGYAPLQFWAKGKGKIHLKDQSSYISEHPAAVITQEMTKKEARKWMEAHKNG